MKKFTKILVAIIAFFLVIGIAACDGNANPIDFDSVLQSYLLDQDGKIVADDFILDNSITIGSRTYKLKWASDKEFITITAREDDYLAEVVRPSEGIETVTLTLSLRTATKEFTVRVKALDVYAIADQYVFAYDRKQVDKDINLPSSFNYLGAEASIRWYAEEEQENVVITENEQGGYTLSVFADAEEKSVKVMAEFSYAGETTVHTFQVIPSEYKTHEQLVDYWYNNTGVSVDMSGYVVAIGTVWSADYNNITLYMMDDDLSTGYYLYRVKSDAATGPKIVPGAHVTVTGTTNSNYNGLIETNAGGNLVIDYDKDGEMIMMDVESYKYAVDEDLIGNVPAAIYHTSIPVSLTNWQVKSVKTVSTDTFKTVTLFTVSKGGATISVAMSKYLEQYYTSFNDENAQAILAKHAEIKEGDWVSISGILGNYNGAQVIVRTADDIQVGEADSATSFAGKKVGEIVSRVSALFTKDIVASPKEITLVASTNDVTVEYEILGRTKAVVLEGGKLVVTPIEKADKAVIKVTYTCGEYSTFTLHEIMSNGSYVEPEEVYNFVEASSVEAGKEYLYRVVQGNLNGKELFVTGENSGNYAASTADYKLAAKIVLVAVEGGYHVKATLTDGSVKYLNAISYAKGANAQFQDEPTTVWTWSEELKTIVTNVSGHENASYDFDYYAGTYSSFETISLSKISYAATSFVGHFGTMVKEGEEPVESHAGTLEDPLTTSDVKALLDANGGAAITDKYYVKGTITSIITTDANIAQYGNIDIMITDGTQEVKVFRMNKANGEKFTEKPAELVVGAELVVYGSLEIYNGTYEVSKACELVSINGSGTTPEEPQPQTVEHAGTFADPLTTADVKALLDNNGGAAITDKYYVKGTVVTVKTTDENIANYGNIDIIITDGTQQITVFRMNNVGGAKFTEKPAELVEGAELLVYGALEMYNTTYEVSKGCQLIGFNGAGEPVEPEPQPEEPTIVHAGTMEDPLDAADVIAIANGFDASANTTGETAYYVKGVIATEPTADYCNFDFVDGETHVVVYGLWADIESNTRFGSNRQIAELPVALGQEVVLYAKVQNYYGKIELNTALLVSIDGVAYTYTQPEPEPEPQPTEGVVTANLFANTFTADASNANLATLVVGDVTFTLNKAGSTTANRLTDADHLRVYKGAHLEIRAAEGKAISKVEISVLSGYTAVVVSVNGTDCTAAEGKLVLSFETPVSEVIIDCANAQWRVNGAAITLAAAGETPVNPDPEPEPEPEPTVEHAGTEADPYTGADAIIVANGLESGAYSVEKYYVKGVVMSEPTANYCNFNLGTETASILVYGLAADAEFTQRFGTSREIAALPIALGDEVVVLAKVQNYRGTTPELAYAQLISINGVAYSYTQPEPEPEPEPEEPTVVHAGTMEDPLDAADVITIASQYDATVSTVSEEVYYVKGVIATDPTADYCNFDFVSDETHVIVYGLWASLDPVKRFGTSREIAELPVALGQEVVLYAHVQNFKGKIELNTSLLVSIDGVAYTYVEPQPVEPEPVEGETTTITVTLANLGYTNQQQVKTIALDENITVTATGGANTGKFYTADGTWRIYYTDSPRGYITISAAEGKTIVSVAVTYKSNSSSTLTVNSKTVASGEVVEVNGSSIQMDAGVAKNAGIQVITVIYK